MNECIFCQVMQEKIPAKKVYEDELCLAILDIRPLNKGHMLLMPKKHIQIAPQMPDAIINHLGIIAKKLSQAALRGFKAQGTTIFMANGAIAGQQIPHVVMHIIPRFDNDNIETFKLPKNNVEPSQLEELSLLLKEYIQKKNLMEKEDQVTVPQKQSHIQAQPNQEKQTLEDQLGQEEPNQPDNEEKPTGGVDLDKISKLF